MATKTPDDPILKRFPAALDEIYGDAVFLEGPDSFWKESRRRAEIEILPKTEALRNGE